jgi:hypothetical protein
VSFKRAYAAASQENYGNLPLESPQSTLATLTTEVADIVEARQLGSHVSQLVLGPHTQELWRGQGAGIIKTMSRSSISTTV